MSPSSPGSLAKLERLFTVSRLLSQAGDMDTLFNIVIQTATELTESLYCSILLYEEETNTLKFAACHPDHQKNSSIASQLNAAYRPSGKVANHPLRMPRVTPALAGPMKNSDFTRPLYLFH
jgi:hypothetical protein